MKCCPRILLCMTLLLVVASASLAQTPKSGALLTIQNSNGSILVSIYDSQIHSGTVQTVPLASEGNTSNCTSVDASYPTDAYVLQGGSPTGCDTGDAYEVTDVATQTEEGITYSPNPNAVHEYAGKVDINGFHIETHYICGGACSGETGSANVCNTSKTICIAPTGPDSGFITITNTSETAFSGTITLQGTSPVSGAPFCPTATNSSGNGVSSDTWTAGLAGGHSVTLALGTQGTGDSPGTMDSSNCGGFNGVQTTTLATGSPSTFYFGTDSYQITPFDGGNGDTLTFLPVPVPAGPQTGGKYGNIGGTGETVLFPSSASFNLPGTSPFAGQTCIAFNDFSAAGNPVCPEIKLNCTPAVGSETNDCGTFLYTSVLTFTKDTNSLSAVGGTNFLGDHNDDCPTTNFNINIFFSYTPTNPDPIKSSSSGNSCFVPTYSPNAAPVTVGNTLQEKTFVGFQSPVVNCASTPCGPNDVINQAKAASVVPLIWQSFDINGNPITNLTNCVNQNGTQANGSACAKPWVFLGYVNIACTGGNTVTVNTVNNDTWTALENLGGGSYQANWRIFNNQEGTCATPALEFSNGFWAFSVAQFKFN
jgi:hypothetical protein